MRIGYYVLDPTGNMTILADTPVDPGDQPRIAARLMELEPGTEQVGFLTGEDTAHPSLRMAGGEFCGNASMSAAVIAAYLAGKTEDQISLQVSGAARPVQVRVASMEDGSWRGTVEMPSPAAVGCAELAGVGPCPLVRFEGITHVILEKEMETDEAEKLAPIWCRDLGADALGLMFLDRAETSLRPLVYVPAAGTLCWENSCASGTTAVGAYLAEKKGRPILLSLRQKGGVLTIEADGDGALHLTGNVRIIRHAFAEID